MLIAVDVDGTLSSYPFRFSAIIRHFRAAGSRVVILTGGLVDDPTPDDDAKHIVSRRHQLRGILTHHVPNDSHDIEIVPCLGPTTIDVAQKKAKWCFENHVDMFFDDNSFFCRTVKNLCPTCLVLHVLEV